jgi:LysM repeat protein
MERASTAAVAAVLLLAVTGIGEAQTLRGSTRTMQRQNLIAQDHDFTFLRTSAQIHRFAESGYLERMRGNADYELAAVSHPYARPAVKLFVERLSAQYRSACGEKLVVTSLTRPVQQQPRNASDLSVHPAGMAVDMRISRKRSCVRWLEKTLLSLEKQGVLDVTRERRPPHYHVALFPQPYTRYVASIAGRSAVQLASAQPKPAAQPPASTAGSSPVAAVEASAARASAVQASAAEASLDDAADLERELEVALDSKDAAGPQLVTANVTPDATDEVGTYRVNRGDSLWSIARRHNTTVDTLKDMNSLKDSYIMAGQIITVPVVASGADES